MFELEGRCVTAKVFSDDVDSVCISQVIQFSGQSYADEIDFDTRPIQFKLILHSYKRIVPHHFMKGFSQSCKAQQCRELR